MEQLSISPIQIRLKLLAILLSQLFVTDLWITIATFELPLCYGLLWVFTRAHYVELTCLYLILVIVRFFQNVFESDSTAEPDRPYSDSIQKNPRFASYINSLRDELGLPVSNRAEFLLSPAMWRPFGCSAPQLRTNRMLTVVPVGCLAIYSVFDLRCELAHAFTRHQSKFIFPACERNRYKLQEFAARPHFFRDRPQWQSWAISKIEAAYEINLSQWNLLADLQADQKVASKYGAFAVSNWIQRSQLANFTVRECIAGRVALLAEEGILLPVAESCRAFHNLFESEWLDSLRNQMVEAERKSEMLSPLLLRLCVLQEGLQNAGGMDPRSATALFDDLTDLEESVVRNEMHTASSITFYKPKARDFAETVLIPLMNKELSRNSGLVNTWTISDLPDLVVYQKDIANSYIPDPRFLLACDQREALIPGFFTSFLTVKLIALGWVPSHSEQDGLTLSLGQKCIHPGNTVHALMTGELTREAFLQSFE